MASNEAVICRLENAKKAIVKECILGRVEVSSCSFNYKDLYLTAIISDNNHKISFEVVDVRTTSIEFQDFEVASDQRFQNSVHRHVLANGFTFSCGQLVTPYNIQMKMRI